MARLIQSDPNDFIAILGASLGKKDHLPLVQIGNITYDRRTLGLIGVSHPVAALRLNRVLQELRIRTLDGLYKPIHEIGNYKGCGVTVYYTVLAILREQGYDPEKAHGEDVTVSTLKTRAMKAAKKRPTKRPRRAGPPSETADAGV